MKYVTYICVYGSHYTHTHTYTSQFIYPLIHQQTKHLACLHILAIVNDYSFTIGEPISP